MTCEVVGSNDVSMPLTLAPCHGFGVLGRFGPRGRVALRIAAVTANIAMLVYVYGDYLLHRETHRFCQMGVGRPVDCTSSGIFSTARLLDHVWHGEFDIAQERLGVFTFSLSMLSNLNLFCVVATPVALVYVALERDRVTWLQMLARQHLGNEARADKLVRQLETYFWTLTAAFIAVLLLFPFHLDMPLAHYSTAACAFSSGFGCMYLYVSLPPDFQAVVLAASNEEPDTFEQWARLQRFVRPTLQSIIVLHFVTLAAGLLKAERLHDDWIALLFGILETLIVVGYQFFVAVFLVDDLVVGKGLHSKVDRVVKEHEGDHRDDK